MSRNLPVSCTLLLAGLIACAGILQADTIYSTFGPGFSFATGTGAIVTNDPLADASVAIAFTPTANYDLTSIEFVASDLFPEDLSPITIAIFADNGGQPGSQPLESFTTGSFGPFGEAALVTTVTSLSQPLLQAGTQYWIGMNASPGDLMVWNQSSTSAAGFSITDGSGNWSASDPAQGQGALEIDGDLVAAIAGPVAQTNDSPIFTPEPLSWWLMASGLAVIARRARSLIN